MSNMIRFKLTRRDKFLYTISVNGITFEERLFTQECLATEWARAWISFMPKSTLDLDFEELPSITEFFKEKL